MEHEALIERARQLEKASRFPVGNGIGHDGSPYFYSNAADVLIEDAVKSGIFTREELFTMCAASGGEENRTCGNHQTWNVLRLLGVIE